MYILGRLLASQRIAKAVDLVLQRHENGDDVRQRLVVLADDEQNVTDVLTQLSTTPRDNVSPFCG